MMRTSNGLRVEAGLIPVLMRVTKAVTLHKKNLYDKHSHCAKCLQAEKAHYIAGSLENYNLVQEEHHCICVREEDPD